MFGTLWGEFRVGTGFLPWSPVDFEPMDGEIPLEPPPAPPPSGASFGPYLQMT